MWLECVIILGECKTWGEQAMHAMQWIVRPMFHQSINLPFSVLHALLHTKGKNANKQGHTMMSYSIDSPHLYVQTPHPHSCKTCYLWASGKTLKYENLKTPRHTKFVAYSSTRCLWLLLTFMLAIIKWSVTFFHVWNLGPRSKHLLTLVKPIHSALVKVLYIQLWDCLIDYSCKDCKTSIQWNSYA